MNASQETNPQAGPSDEQIKKDWTEYNAHVEAEKLESSGRISNSFGVTLIMISVPVGIFSAIGGAPAIVFYLCGGAFTLGLVLILLAQLLFIRAGLARLRK